MFTSLCKVKMASAATRALGTRAEKILKSAPAWRVAFAKWAYNHSYFNQLGMMHDDTLNTLYGHQGKIHKEAVRRLPKELQEERQYRISRALHLSMRKEVLPKEEWTSWETDVQYLQPYIKEVEKEYAERDEWNKN